MTRTKFDIDSAVECLDKYHADHGVVAVAGVHLAAAIKAIRASVRLQVLAARVAGVRGYVDYAGSLDADDLSGGIGSKHAHQMPEAMWDALGMAFVPRPVLGAMGQTIARIDEALFLDAFSESSALGVVAGVARDSLGLRWVMGVNEAHRILAPVFAAAGMTPGPHLDGTFIGVLRSSMFMSQYRRLTSAEPHFLMASGTYRMQEVYDVTRATLIMASVMGEFK